jgi:hypothetical protein
MSVSLQAIKNRYIVLRQYIYFGDQYATFVSSSINVIHGLIAQMTVDTKQQLFNDKYMYVEIFQRYLETALLNNKLSVGAIIDIVIIGDIIFH